MPSIGLAYLCCTQAMDKPLDWAVHTVRELPTNVSGRVVLIGDAVCGMIAQAMPYFRSDLARTRHTQ